ncbi:isoprenylcysteine carboxylmethyltransferase family protein [Longicatena caecimuris]|uniref:methyltransferase family protein n=1 Tax=Longicatena caecimuris TaxID=1796635 RepID=UPI001D02C0BA|nr:isoprenylcysteine carboxylmethyltransferase family protein [Longicatena caecimuris]MCB5393416.1 isoprenylcysteine carboxylmethyltransferase family protein [Longicatena caecimuris]MCB5564371.1 isoprenylcysteine carboxylmethyltransferase family protein [Longicatena caecimuris]
MNKNKNHLPLYGVGPVYVAVIITVTMAGILLSQFKIIVYLSFSMIKMVLLMIGALLIAVGAVLWVLAVFRAKIDDGIANNRLVTDSVYALVRNPIYSAFLSVCTGTLMIYGNLWLLILPVLYWLFLTVMMKCTEEKWLKNLYGVEYEEYCRRVNRCIPWFPKNR